VSAVSRYVVYLRVSTDQQADIGQGLEIQEQACRAWLRKGRHQLVEVCRDGAKSGSLDLDQRHGLARAIGLVGAGRADGIVVYRLDRLSRDLILQEQVLAELHRHGNELHSCSATEDEHLVDDPDDPTRALVRRILGAVAAHEREVIRLRLRTGRYRKQLAGGYAGGAPAYGWRSTGRELEEVPAEQEAIRLMVRLHKQGRSYRQVAEALEAREIPLRRGGTKWHPNTIREIVMRESARKRPARNGVTPSPELMGVSA
jgi:DNA invertase Pin-like site-specific DNA recombinase